MREKSLASLLSKVSNETRLWKDLGEESISVMESLGKNQISNGKLSNNGLNDDDAVISGVV